MIPGGTERTNPAIGGTTVAFEDRDFSTDPNQSEMLVYDLGSGGITRLTNDALMDINPSVSPDGNVIVWQKCTSAGSNCNVYEAIQTAPGVWMTSALTGGAGENTNPHTDGAVVVYASARNGEIDIYYQPVDGGAETQLSISGEQRNPSISHNLISFESQVGTEFDVFVYNIASGKLYQATNTIVDETLNDISVCNGIARIVYSAPGPNGDFDVYGFTFQPPSSTVAFVSFSGKLDATPSAGQFDLNGKFTIGSSGINPITEQVVLQIGSYSVAIPANSFAGTKKGAYVFQGTIAGVPLQIRINSAASGGYTIQAQGSGANLSGLTNPVPVTLTIGDDAGTTQINAQIS